MFVAFASAGWFAPPITVPRRAAPILALASGESSSSNLQLSRLLLESASQPIGQSNKGTRSFSPLQSVRGSLLDFLEDSSARLWKHCFDECDINGDGNIDMRELLVVLKRLELDIPPADDLKTLIREVDVDEDGVLNFDEFSVLMRTLKSPWNANAYAKTGVRITAVARDWLRKRRRVVLWRDLFDKLDSLPRDGFLGPNELHIAFEQVGITSLTRGSKDLKRRMNQYDRNGDGRLSFDEFSKMATDLIWNSLQYERALLAASDRLSTYDDAANRANVANMQAAEYMRLLDSDVRQQLAAEASTSNSGSRRSDSTAERDAARLGVIESRIQGSLSRGFGSDTSAVDVLRVQDDLYRRFKTKYGNEIELNDYLTAERVLLLDAIKTGDLNTIRALTEIDWNFVYPPAMLNSSTGERQLEGWCRTPLCLLVRPDEGNFRRSMVGVSEAERLELLKDVLASGCADPNFPPTYWGGPAVHACFEGDVVALEMLRQAGCNLRQRLEWLLQDAPLFSLVHAAAFNGQLEVLQYLREHLPPSVFREVDAELSNPLHTLLESSRDIDAARFLLGVGVDGFAINKGGRSPLSMAIETMPELALELLNAKSRFEYRWWGNDLYWYSFGGIVLPLSEDQSAPPSRAEEGTGVLGAGVPAADAPDSKRPETAPDTAPVSKLHKLLKPLVLRDGKGQPVTIEELILRHERKELLETPLMLDLLERKWSFFAGKRYRNRFGIFSAMAFSVFVASVGEPGTPLFYAATSASAVSWALFGNDQLRRLRSKSASLNFFEALDLYSLAFVPVVTAWRVATSVDLEKNNGLVQSLSEVLALFDGALQVTLALSILNLVAIFKVLGPLLITVTQMLSDSVRFAVVLGIVLVGFANGFYSLIHFGVSSEYLASLSQGLSFDYSYMSIVSQMCLWLAGGASLDMIEPLSPSVQLGASALFWSFIVTSYFVLLNLLIAIFNTAYERITSNSMAEWLFIRLKKAIEYEADPANIEGVRVYYEQLVAVDNQRAVTAVREKSDKK